jgi:hydroxymethylpyrimidine pyrophosphatase-like HAD family hydrolase
MNALDIDREDSIAFGDGPNDVEMIQYAQTGVVMGNGFSDLKKVADYVTTDINDNGVWNGMKHLGLIG